jgi:plasmid stabilization system protein ParE
MRLRYTLPALADLTSVLDWIAERSPQGAARIHTRIRAVTDLLLRYPLAGAVTDDSPFGASRRRLTHISASTRRRTLKLSFMRCATAPATLPTRYDRSKFSQNHLQGVARFGPCGAGLNCDERLECTVTVITAAE